MDIINFKNVFFEYVFKLNEWICMVKFMGLKFFYWFCNWACEPIKVYCKVLFLFILSIEEEIDKDFVMKKGAQIVGELSHFGPTQLVS